MIYQTVDAAVRQSGPRFSAAEAHGIAAGMLCANAKAQGGEWLREMFGEQALTEADRLLLMRLFEETRRLLASDDFEFEPLLPDDDNSLEERLQALKTWCQGFLYGVGLFVKEGGQDGEIREIVRDIGEFTKLDAAAEGEENEQAYMEVTEYLRAAVLMLREAFGQR